MVQHMWGVSCKIIIKKSATFSLYLTNTGKYVTGLGTQATGEHFKPGGHSLADMKFSVLETFKKGSHHLRKEREKSYINKFNTKHKGLKAQQQEG